MKKIIAIIFALSLFATAQAQNADINLLKSINLDRNRSLDPTFKFITHSVAPVCIALPTSMFTISLFNKDSTLKRNSVYIGTSIALSSLITISLKYIVKRKRPFETHPEIDKQTSGRSYSFPSGHTTVAFATATAVSLAYPKWYVIAPSFIWAGAVGYSRMHLGVHYPSDVLVGILVGIGTSFLCNTINQNIR